MSIDLTPHRERVAQSHPVGRYGRVTDVVGLTVAVIGPPLSVGSCCWLEPRGGGERVAAEVVGFREGRTLLMPLGSMHGIGPGSLVIPSWLPQRVRVGNGVLGRVLDARGQTIDGGPPPDWEEEVPLLAPPPAPLTRRRIREPIATGVRAIDMCTTLGKGQRVGIMSGSGVGKSKLLGMIARNTSADINVIALIGERGREVREFIENDLGPEGLARSVVVVATSDEPALRRINGAYLATAVAEWFRGRGADVMLMMDSVTRFAMAQREVGLAVGEPPATRGYPPSVFALLPQLLERAGTSAHGSITGIYAVLVEGDDLNDPVGDAVRSILDGHVALSRDLASRGHYPPVDVLDSVSRTMTDVTRDEHRALAAKLRGVLSTYREAEDLVNIGAYVAGSNPEIDEALRVMPKVRRFLRQGLQENTPFADLERLVEGALRA